MENRQRLQKKCISNKKGIKQVIVRSEAGETEKLICKVIWKMSYQVLSMYLGKMALHFIHIPPIFSQMKRDTEGIAQIPK